jgi:LacI family transcriptional regulator, gluconate utilization system Gnt-I transcriptional repressor
MSKGLSPGARTCNRVGHPPPAPVRMEDVARIAGVSVITVSRAVREPDRVAAGARSRIMSAIADVGYVPNLVAGTLKSRRSGFVAGVIPSVTPSSPTSRAA